MFFSHFRHVVEDEGSNTFPAANDKRVGGQGIRRTVQHSRGFSFRSIVMVPVITYLMLYYIITLIILLPKI